MFSFVSVHVLVSFFLLAFLSIFFLFVLSYFTFGQVRITVVTVGRDTNQPPTQTKFSSL